MTHLTNISQNFFRTAISCRAFLRMVLCLALLLGVAFNAGAQTDYSVESKWDGTAATPTGGTTLRTKSLIDPSCTGTAGSATNPYLIESAADLKYLQSKNNSTNQLWSKCFEQMVDIDLDCHTHGKVLGMIGNGTTSFSGKYDGRGHKIRNLRVEWNNTTNIALGLFGYVTGEVRNLVVDNALVTFTKALSAGSTDFKVGVLAGAIAPPAKLENISVVNSKITDNGFTGNIKASFVGGLVGDVASGFGGSALFTGNVAINNIYSEVEIDLPNYTPNGDNAYQINIGGVVGRVRRGKAKDLPTNTVFTGRIKAPEGMAGPIFGAARADGGDNAGGMKKHYAGQVQKDNATSSNQNTANILIANDDFNATNHFYDYILWDPTSTEDDKYKLVTSSWPKATTDVGGDGRSVIRTIVEPVAAEAGNKTAASITMHAFQGVNKGDLLADASAAETLLSGLNSSSTVTSNYDWSFDAATKDATFTEKSPAVRSVKAEQTAWNQFTATVTGATEGETFKYAWYKVYNNGTSELIEKTPSNTLTSSDVFYDPNIKEVLVILCNNDAEGTLFNDHEHTVFDFVLGNVFIDYDIENDGGFIVITPKVLYHQGSTEVAVSKDGFTFEVQTVNSSDEVVSFTTLNAKDGTAFRLPPTVNAALKIELLGAYGSYDAFRTGQRTVPADCYIDLASSLAEREFLPEGVKTTVTLKTGKGTALAYTDDWEMNVTWQMKDLDPTVGDWNKVTDNGVTDDGKLWGLKGDHALKTRNMDLKLIDAYGFPVNRNANGFAVPVTINRSLKSLKGQFQTYYFEYKMTDGPVMNGNTSKFIDYKYYTNTDVDNYQPLPDIATLEDDIFTIKRIHMADAEYHVRMYDKYDSKHTDGKLGWPFSSTFTIKAPTGDNIVNEDGKLVPELTVGSVTRNFKQAEWGVKYDWTVQYYNANDVLISEKTDTKSGLDSYEPVEYFGAAKAAVTIIATDYLGKTKTIEKTFTLKDFKVEIVQTGEAPNYTFTASVSTDSGFPIYGGTWQWYGINGDITEDTSNRFLLAGQTSNTLTLNATNNNYSSYCAVWTSSDGTKTNVGYWSKKDVVYVFNKTQSTSPVYGVFTEMVAQYPDGNDINDGRTPQTAVQTMKRAYEILGAGNKAADNIIVVMGYLDDNENFWATEDPKSGRQVRLPKAGYEKDATITGSYGEISGGVIKVQAGGNSPKALSGATILQNITLEGESSELNLYAYLHDLTFANGVKIHGYNNLASTNGILPKTTAPAITVVGGYHNYDLNYLPLPECPPSNAVKGMQTLTFQSGCLGRIIACARNDGGGISNSFNTFGSPETPHHVTVKVAIKHSKDENGNSNKYEYCPGKTYNFDIGMLVGGQTDGTTYAETDLYVNSGTIGRFVAGNISYGRSTDDEHPDDGFYGSTTLTLEGGEIMELVGGSLGRSGTANSSTTKRCEAYFYGRAILNINGGIINSNLYAAGTGGVVGFADDKGNHTNDKQIPYIDNATGELLYGDYQTVVDNGKMPVIVMLDGTPLDLADSYCKININAGVVNGNVYGGGYGYTDQIPDDKIDRANEQSGNLYGNSYINIKGGTIKGNVYGGGAGSTLFYEKSAEADKWKYESLANIYGKTNVTISGGIIEGKVFAGSKGISGFPKMATLYGSTKLVIENTDEGDVTRVPIINGNIYGGSELGEITDSTNVTINGGAIGNCIFGGSEGIEKDKVENGKSLKKTTAKIGGSTYLTITDGTYFTDAYAAKISADKRLPAADRTFNIYGGGYNNCVINGSTNVNIYKSLLSSYQCLIEPDPKDATKKRKFEDCVKDETYRKFSVYGAGRGELTDVKGDAIININIEGGASVPSAKPVDVANGQQFFMIAGGGMAGHVWKDTKVTLDGNVFARRIYGGGMYGNVLGDANLTVHRGSYYGVFGGGLLGNVKGNANLKIGTKAGYDPETKKTISAEDAATANRNLYIYDNVYGGNDVSGCTGYETTDSLWNDGDTNNMVNLSAGQQFLADGEKFEMNAANAGHHYLFEHWDEMGYLDQETQKRKPYYRHLIRASEEKGVNMKIYGGKILGDVFGAGNGNHTGYYVPNMAESESHTLSEYTSGTITRMKFYEGLPYHYRVNKKDDNSYDGGKLRSVLDEQVRKDYGLYEYRPRVGKVVMHIGGNSESDRVEIGGDVYGGGHACTIGMYDPSKDVLTDPLKFKGGGSLHINFGSHVTVKKSVYMGSRGRIIGQQTVKGEHKYNGITLNSDMDYHYYDPNYDNGDGTKGRYLLGFPNTKEGRMSFHAYVQLVNMDATTELSFFDQTDNKESKDVRWGSFFAGGARGSMTKRILAEDDDEIKAAGGKTSDLYKKTRPYEYTLPAGLTIETRVVGGSEDAEITYYDYTSKTGEDAFTAIDETKPLFTFKGGIVYDEHIDGHFGGGQVEWHGVAENSPERIVGDEDPRGSLTVMKLNVNCQFDPQKIDGKNDNFAALQQMVADGVLTAEQIEDEEETFKDYYGGLVYGGCYNSGITNGSVEVKCTNNMLGEHFYSDDYHDYLLWSSLRRNIGRVYGGGFGKDATILGNTKVTLTDNARCFNVFGGGMMGDVTGGTEIEISGLTSVYNAVYGGSLRGNIGKDVYDYDDDTTTPKHVGTDGDLYAKGTHIRLISGGVDRVYGGGFIGTIYGGTHIVASDEDQPEGTPRLMVGSIFGGNDVSGDVFADKTDPDEEKQYCTDIRINEAPRADKESYAMSHESEAEAGKFYGGFPLIGSVYGAGNGNMADYIKGVYIGQDDHEYRQGLIHIASGNGADYHTLNLGKRETTGEAYGLPDIAGKTRITVNGGTIVNVYGGGSMSTVKGSDEVIVNYTDTVARAAVPTSQIDPMTWGVLRLFEDLQQQEVTTIFKEKKDGGGTVTQPKILRFSYQIYRVFGGNNLMDMAIQPKLDLRRGQLFSVYSGGNFGRMTYKNPAATLADGESRGLSLTINSPDIHLSSVYGGGRVGDIDAGEDFTNADEYGATLNILDGLIGDVYGGNNVAGNVRNGTNVNIHGAISGNVYGSGNGNYIYYYDYDGSKSDPIVANQITEGYDEDYGGRYFILPKKAEFGDTPEDKILAINSYRPNVDKAFLYIEGMAPQPSVGTEGEDGYKPARPARQVYVRGSVYCGGNSSTVLYNQEHPELSKIKFKIGNYVTLGGVFLGSNGEGLANSNNITWLGNLNGITSWNVKPTKLTGADMNVYPSLDEFQKLYPNLLSLYMRAAEVTALPMGFAEDEFGSRTLTEAHIGNFTIGGNRGSMMTDKTITMTLPESLVIFGRVVGGCYNSCVEYHGVEAHGGMAKPLAGTATDKLNLTIKSKFRPWRLLFNEDTHAISLVNDRTDEAGNYVSETDKVDGTTYYYGEDRCDIFGGCYTSGKTVGNINIDLYSDVLGYYESGKNWDKTETVNGITRRTVVDRDILKNNVKARRTVFALTGAGYGPESVVEGDVRLRLMPTENGQLSNGQSHHPSISTIFGGAHNGKHIGKSTTEIRDGMVFSNLYAGSRAALKYGSSEVIVGYPKYYICNTNGTYNLDRADKVTAVAKNNQKNHDETPVIKKTVMYQVGDIVAANVFDRLAASEPRSNFTEKHELPTDFKTSWDKIDINIGDNSAMNTPSAKFYGGGGIYGGGHAINESGMTYSGTYTQLAYGAQLNDEKRVIGYDGNDYLKPEDKGYGGNSTIIIGDNTDANESQSHISIGTGHYVEVKIPEKGDKIGKYIRKVETVDGDEKVSFIHQASGLPSATETYYTMEADGGVYGDGRRTFVQNFRAVDITGYGYADHTPQSAKLINSFQRIDLLSLNDCCLQLQGAQDYATNSIDATVYSIARIGELRMNSTITGDLDPGKTDPNATGNTAHNKKRSRNYMGFFNNVHYIGAMVSNTAFESAYRDEHGVKQTGSDAQSYKDKKNSHITDYEVSETKTTAMETAFKKRNLATSPNMIGINNGYTLRLNNAYTTNVKTNSGVLKDVPMDNIYYGPIIGVMEVKLLTLAEDEGGGYIYAFNCHEEDKDKTDASKGKTFLESSGNFVYPSAISTGAADETPDNYIVDDCHPQGYYDNRNNATSEDVHYWYVQGHHYYFNTTLTAYTYNQDINFKLNNTDELINLSGITTGAGGNSRTIQIQDITWEEHLTDDDKCALTNDITDAEGNTHIREQYQLYLTIDKNTGNEYNLSKSEGTYTNIGNAFVARIPNGNNTTKMIDGVETLVPAYGAAADGTIQFVNNYSDNGSEKNSPLLGIRLQDIDNLNYTPNFYKAHLDEDDNLVINITADANDGTGKKNTYTIRLKIVYLQGPYIDGKVTIENCALPGEFIYANTGTVQMEMDDALTVTGKKWYLYPRQKADPDNEIYTWATDPKHRVDVSKYLMDNITGDVNRVELPARYYQNDWKLGYSIVVNGQDFPLPEPTGDDAYSNHIAVHNYHRMSTVAQEIKKDKTYGYDLDLDLVGGALVYIEDDEDFEIFTKYVNYCNGFRSSIADNEKVTGYTYEVKDGVLWQKEADGHEARVLRAEVLPGYNANGYITGYKNDNTILGMDDDEDVQYQNIKNPSGAENIRFILANDIKVTKDCEPITEFRGRLNGNGHIISFEYDPETHKSAYTGENFILRNYGTIRDVGFVTNGADDTQKAEATAVIKENRGGVNNAFYFHYPEGDISATGDYSAGAKVTGQKKYAVLIGENQKNEDLSSDPHPYEGKADNCYQNTNSVNAATTDGVSYYTSEAFHYGLVAYNLNKEYLKARQSSKDDGDLVNDNMSTDNVLYNYYADGDYRYANVRSDEHPEGLRLSDNFGNPNYENYLGSGRTMHETDQDKAHDDRRWFTLPDKNGQTNNKLIKRDERGNIVYTKDNDGNVIPEMTNEGYFPIYLYDALDNGTHSPDHLADHSDFIFFGQRLTPDKDDRQYYPRRINAVNRVYRAGGFYGSRVDSAFHFNRDAWAMQKTLTAIDFTGYYDEKESAGTPMYKENWNDHKITGDMVQHVYYPPVLDIPGGDKAKNLHNLTSFDVVSNDIINDYSKITKNLLVYTPIAAASESTLEYDETDCERLFSKLHYKRMQHWGDVNGETNQNDIVGHHLIWVNHIETGKQPHFHISNNLFHLVDEQNFNAPIEFVVAGDGEQTTGTDGRAWMLRQPKGYASRISTTDANGFSVSKDAWESIALPFTVNRVWAVNSGDYNEKYSRGQISHFYGESETHHDYWLRGLTGAKRDDCAVATTDEVEETAMFARPGKSYTDADNKAVTLFEVKGEGGKDEQMRGDYEYLNNWFYNSYKDVAYSETHNEYAEPMMFEDYCYLTKNAPYIIAFPGEDYYEFDLSGNFYNKKHGTNGCHQQEILYEFRVEDAKEGKNFDSQTQSVRIPVTDVYDAVRTTTVLHDGGYKTSHCATFMRIAGSEIKDNMYVLNDTEITTINAHGETMNLPAGSVFVRLKDLPVLTGISEDDLEILPFRTYLEVSEPSGGAPSMFVAIGSGSRGIDDIGDQDDQTDEEKPEYKGVNLYVENGNLVITSDHDFILPLYGISGQLYRRLNVNAGYNLYRGLNSGVYIALGKKFVIRR